MTHNILRQTAHHVPNVGLSSPVAWQGYKIVTEAVDVQRNYRTIFRHPLEPTHCTRCSSASSSCPIETSSAGAPGLVQVVGLDQVVQCVVALVDQVARRQRHGRGHPSSVCTSSSCPAGARLHLRQGGRSCRGVQWQLTAGACGTASGASQCLLHLSKLSAAALHRFAGGQRVIDAVMQITWLHTPSMHQRDPGNVLRRLAAAPAACSPDRTLDTVPWPTPRHHGRRGWKRPGIHTCAPTCSARSITVLPLLCCETCICMRLVCPGRISGAMVAHKVPGFALLHCTAST